MGKLFMCARQGWKPPYEATDGDDWEPDVHEAGIASGPQLVVGPERRRELLQLFPEVYAIEMEGEGTT